jgi:hypothetical protein
VFSEGGIKVFTRSVRALRCSAPSHRERGKGGSQRERELRLRVLKRAALFSVKKKTRRKKTLTREKKRRKNF